MSRRRSTLFGYAIEIKRVAYPKRRPSERKPWPAFEREAIYCGSLTSAQSREVVKLVRAKLDEYFPRVPR